MHYHKIRLALIILFIVLGIVLHTQSGIQDAIYFYVAAILLTAIHFLFGSVWQAFHQLKRGKFMEAEILLNQIKRPELLLKSPRAYYHFSKGMIALQNKSLEVGGKHFEEAVKLGLRNDNDRALAYLNLAHAAYFKKQFDVAKNHLKTAQSFETKDLIVKDHLSKLEKALGKVN